ncbi:para-aminobenzoate synthase [Acidocella aquatica]|uniref:aminodeoxychorismate synthase n=1 Tax=Acidocella aquatica TaxID=1922313 RepID=A0ABQ6AAS5_9PROT|nr:aminodeoxychorismate synthase component I [Acidocella aquatica]GLR68867.1 para-aminobenzoate synthase [Acidocella aquatica]
MIRELPWRAPQDCFAALSPEPYLAFLDSAATGDARSQLSYICLDPFKILRDASLSTLAAELARHQQIPGPLPFTGGAVGFFGYDLGLGLEPVASRHANPLNLPDMVIGLYDTLIGFDHTAQRCWLIMRDRPGQDTAARANTLLARLTKTPTPAPLPKLHWQPDMDRAEYIALVEQILSYIRAGDIYQANFTLRHTALRPAGLDPASLYLALRAASPAPFAAYLDCGEGLALLSASPERFISLSSAGEIETRPIKGTRPRHADAGRDAALATELGESPKDRAENLMIVDLLRHDIGRVTQIGSVRVPEFLQVESFASVHHLVSAITGRLRPGLGALDLLRATLPGGSITGAPKIRAMQIIDELEPCRRGPYCGTIAWIGFDGAMDSSIIIRTLIVTPGHVLMQAGGGIVADSQPEAEYEEMRIKASPMLGVCGG